MKKRTHFIFLWVPLVLLADIMEGAPAKKKKKLARDSIGEVETERPARRRARRLRDRTETSSHDHEHAHAQESGGLALGVGVETSMIVREGAPKADSDDQNQKDTRLHLHGGDEGGTEGGEGSGESGKIQTLLVAKAAYRFQTPWSLGLDLGLSPESGLEDPLLYLSHGIHLTKSIEWNSKAGATAPLSRESMEQTKTTTLSISTGPTGEFKKWTLSGSATGAYSLYGSEARKAESDHASLRLSAEEHEEVEDREVSRFGGATSAKFKLSGAFSVAGSGGLSIINKEPGSGAEFETLLTPASSTYSWKNIAATAALSLSRIDDSPAIPDTVSIAFAVEAELQ